MSIIELRNISKNYRRYHQSHSFKEIMKELINRKYVSVNAVKELSFKIEAGEMVGLLGPNGSGKSTTMKLLSGILKPTNGEISVNGFTSYQRKKDFLKSISLIMGQKTQLWWDLPAIDTFMLMKQIYQIPEKIFNDRLDFLVEGFKINHLLNIQVRRLSLGERMKMEIISMLLHAPKVLLLDEPTIGLDMDAQNSIRSMLKSYNENYNTTMILTSHYLKDVTNLCARVIVLNHGSLIYDGSLESLKNNYTSYLGLTIKTFDSSLVNWENYGRVINLAPRKVVLRIERGNLMSTLDLLKNANIEECLIEEPSIEDTLRELFSKANSEVAYHE